MGQAFKVDTATAAEASWDFVEDGAAMKVVDDVSRNLASQYEDYLEVRDVRQDALLWTAVRPAVQERLRNGGSYREYFSNLRSGLSKMYADRFQFTIAEFNEEIQ